MKKDKDKTKHAGQSESNNKKDNLSGYPSYPASEDIYNIYEEATEINPEDISKVKERNEMNEEAMEKEIDLNAGLSEFDLDVPGAELDDTMENIGSEDEENNYYSIGGDNHAGLDENQGD
ncbi:MAG: hypothetical protein HOO86_13540 [Bacteroidales bacterium]|nr:hypothetical protein [Bacteroidales bacterium]